jgi:phosphate transport system substrate-binding protein
MSVSFRSRWIADALVAALAIAGLAAGGCRSTPSEEGEIRIAGSDTMLPLNRRLAEAFMRDHPGVAVWVDGGGTERGVELLLDGAVGLCAASRPFRPDEIGALYDAFGTIGLRHLVARDALSVVVNPGNPVRSLTMDELAAIFEGRLVSWAEVGGPEAPIEVMLRPPTSGTFQFFRDHVLAGRSYTTMAVIATTALEVEELVARRPSAIGYGGLVHGDGVIALHVDGVEPSVATVRSGDYPLARYLLFYAAEPPSGATRTFVEWCASAAGQRVVAETGLIPLWIDD